MSKLVGFDIENFRVFAAGQYTEIDLKPITLITGTNSAGKSSLFKALLLLQDNWQRNKLKKLDFTKSTHKLGSLSSIRNCPDKPVKFRLRYEDKLALEYHFDAINNELVLTYFCLWHKEQLILKIKNEDKAFQVKELAITWFEFGKDDLRDTGLNNLWEIEINEYVNTLEDEQWSKKLEKLKIRLSDSSEIKSIKKIYREKSQQLGQEIKLVDTDYKLIHKDKERIKKVITELEKEQNIITKRKQEIVFSENKCNTYLTILGILQKVIEYKYDNSTPQLNNVNNAIENLQNTIEETNAKLMLEDKQAMQEETGIQSQISNEEEKIKNLEKKFLSDKVDTEIQKIEEEQNYEIDQILHLRSKIMKYLSDKHIDKISNFITKRLNWILASYNIPITHLPAYRAEQKRTVELAGLQENYQIAVRKFLSLKEKSPERKFIRTWLKNFEILYEDIQIEEVKDTGNRFRVFLCGADGNNLNLADLGFGISQLLPIIFACAMARQGQIITIEEPETSLHPKLQSLLAQMFTETYNRFKAQFIVETHSEYLVTTLQHLVVNIDPNKKLTYHNALIYYIQSGQMKKSGIDEFGSIDESIFGEGFFDVIPNLKSSLWNTIINSNNHILFVEGKTDKLLFQKAIHLFAPELNNLCILTNTSNTGAGINWVKDSLLSWVYNRDNDDSDSKALAILDNDEDARNMRNDLSNDSKYKTREKKGKVKLMLLSTPKWLINIHQKNILEDKKVDYSIEHFFPTHWQHAKSKNWLVERKKRIRFKNTYDISEIEYLKENKISDLEQVLLYKQIDNEKKMSFTRYLCNLEDAEKVFEPLKEEVKNIKEFFTE